MVFLSGQVARNTAGELVGPNDLAAQTEQAYLNVAAALASVGGSFDDVAKLTIYVLDWTADKMTALMDGISRASKRLGINPVKPGTLIGVAALNESGYLVEVDATAVLP
jgi:enamine deaminase RidA (YjgF/YER057c/UK114 family)